MSKPKNKTEKLKELFLIALEKNNGNKSKSAKEVGVHITTVYKWIKEYPEFTEEIKNIEEAILDKIEQHLYSQSEGGIPTSTIFYLKQKGKHRGWGEENIMNSEIGEINITIKKKDNQ